MQIIIQQEELEIALREYITKLGIGRPVHSINFSQTRGQGNNLIVTTVDLNDVGTPAPETAPAGPTPRAQNVEPMTSKADQKDTAETPAPKPSAAAKSASPANKPAAAALEEAGPQEAPETDSANTEADAPAGKSLFG